MHLSWSNIGYTQLYNMGGFLWYLGWFYVTLYTYNLSGFGVAGLFQVKVGINRNRISADDNTRYLETSVEIATAKTLVTTWNISRIWVNCS